MNCQEFQSNVDAVARGSLADARTRGEAAAHEEACATCAARLADERALTAGLRALAAKMSGTAAPARAESALLAAFRSRAAEASNAEVAASAAFARPTAAASTMAARSTAAAASTTHAASNVVSLSEHAGARQWSWVKTVAVASLAAVAVALFMLVPPILTPEPPGSGESAASRPRSAQIVQTQEGVRPVEAAGAGASQGSEPSEVAGSRESQDGGVDSPPVRPPGQRRAAAPVRALNAGFSRGLTNEGSRGGSLASEREGVGEVTTDFIPLMQGAAFTQTEAARLVRVEIPRAALASFGIPLNGERAGGRVKADLLLGEDGTARAIRFVR
jgi:hypothetical protein